MGSAKLRTQRPLILSKATVFSGVGRGGWLLSCSAGNVLPPGRHFVKNQLKVTVSRPSPASAWWCLHTWAVVVENANLLKKPSHSLCLYLAVSLCLWYSGWNACTNERSLSIGISRPKKLHIPVYTGYVFYLLKFGSRLPRLKLSLA